MSLFDIILLCIIAGFGLFGLWFGLISTLGSIVGTILGVYLASRWYVPVADWLIKTTGWSPNFSKVVIFIIVFLIINRLVGFVFYIVGKLLRVVTRLPFIKGLDRLLGLAFGILEGLIVLGIIFYFINKFPVSPKFMTMIAESKIAPYTLAVASLLWPLIPPALKSIKDYLPI